MAEEYVKDEDKMLCAAAYAVGVPSLYIILTDKRKEKFAGFHGAQALFLWVAIIVFWVAMRVVLDVIWSIIYLPFLNSLVSLAGLLLWLFALYSAYRAYMGEYFTIPYISDFVKQGD
jgi:uncharacterized membrane protein